jgi:hypothetical protein|tara:strand:+ start:8829 stop:10856 length:2028 start_codon:yes stop_codon:yes gene_type:complete
MAEENEEDLTLEQQYAAYGQGRINSLGVTDKNNVDPSLEYPKYSNESSVNRVARGVGINNLDLKIGQQGVPLNVSQKVGTIYQRAKIDETPSGHVIELNDTPAGERILIKHNTGAGFDIRPDGAIVTSAKTDQVQVVGADYHLVVGGDGKLTYHGNLDLNVTGDLNMTVGGNFIFKVKGSIVADVLGSVTKKVVGNVRETIKGIYQSIRLGQTLQITLGGFSNYVKGSFKQLIHGTAAYNHKNDVNFTGAEDLDLSANSVNIAGRSMSVFGDTGTIGGENIIMYNYNMHTKKTVWTETIDATAAYANTFHGSLNGTANFSKKAAVASGKSTGGVPGPTINSTAKDTTATALPTGILLNDYLDNSSKGVRKVNIDGDSGIAKSIDLSSFNGDVIDRDLDPREVRARMKDPANLNNTTFVSNQISEGKLNPSFKNSAPGEVARVVTTLSTTNVGQTAIGKNDDYCKMRYRQSPGLLKAGTFDFVVDPKYNPNNLTEINSKTRLHKNIPLARFLGGEGDAHNLNHVTELSTKKQIARNLILQANIMSYFNDLESMNGFNLVVSEGLYKPYVREVITSGSVLDYRSSGRAVAYEMYQNSTGLESFDKLFEFAELVKDSFQYQELSLRYDEFDPKDSGKSAQLVIIMPEMPETFTANYDRKLSTYYNENLQSDEALVELV